MWEQNSASKGDDGDGQREEERSLIQMATEQNRGMNVTEMHDVFCVDFCFSSAQTEFIYLGENYPLRFLTAALSPLGIGIGRGRGRLSARQTAALSLSLNEQVHRELRRVEAAATTDNERTNGGGVGHPEPARPAARTGDGATCRGSDTPHVRVRRCIRACVRDSAGPRGAARTRDLKFYA